MCGCCSLSTGDTTAAAACVTDAAGSVPNAIAEATNAAASSAATTRAANAKGMQQHLMLVLEMHQPV